MGPGKSSCGEGGADRCSFKAGPGRGRRRVLSCRPVLWEQKHLLLVRDGSEARGHCSIFRLAPWPRQKENMDVYHPRMSPRVSLGSGSTETVECMNFPCISCPRRGCDIGEGYKVLRTLKHRQEFWRSAPEGAGKRANTSFSGFYAEARRSLTLSGVRVGSAGETLPAPLQGHAMISHILPLTLARLFRSLFTGVHVFMCTLFLFRLCTATLPSDALLSLCFRADPTACCRVPLKLPVFSQMS